MIDQFRRHLSLDAQRLAGRVGWIGFERCEPTVLQRCGSATARGAQRTVGRDVLDRGISGGGHASQLTLNRLESTAAGKRSGHTTSILSVNLRTNSGLHLLFTAP